MTNPFIGITTTDEIKNTYRKLAMQHHPDRGGDTATMQKLNAFYHAALKGLDGATFKRHDNGKEYTYRYDYKKEDVIITMFNKAVALNMPDVEIMIIGSWVWCRGNTQPVRRELSKAGFKWHSKRTAWYWRVATKQRRSFNPRMNLDELQDYYGGVSKNGTRREGSTDIARA